MIPFKGGKKLKPNLKWDLNLKDAERRLFGEIVLELI